MTYSLEPVYQDLLREISFVTRRPMSDELRMLIDARAQILGLTPVNVVDPKIICAASGDDRGVS